MTMKVKVKLVVLLVSVVCGIINVGVSQGDGSGLRQNFYQESCPLAEYIVRNVTWNHVSTNPNLPAKLLRMHFHDCFVRGCDGSILLNSTANNTAEKDAIPNQTLSGFDVIDDIKKQVEAACKGVVSCADILALAARDSVSFQFQKPMWEVLTGRRDGTVSQLTEALANLPAPFLNFTQLKQNFATKNLSVHDLVVLSGGHTIGVGHCRIFSNRLFNFTGKGDQDPSLNATYAELLKTECDQDQSDATTTVEMDPGSSQSFDSSYYAVVEQNKGLFSSDAALLTNDAARDFVHELLDNNATFFGEFAQSMKKMGAIEVLTGTSGQIRNQCWLVN